MCLLGSGLTQARRELSLGSDSGFSWLALNSFTLSFLPVLLDLVGVCGSGVFPKYCLPFGSPCNSWYVCVTSTAASLYIPGPRLWKCLFFLILPKIGVRWVRVVCVFWELIQIGISVSMLLLTFNQNLLNFCVHKEDLCESFSTQNVFHLKNLVKKMFNQLSNMFFLEPVQENFFISLICTLGAGTLPPCK